MAKETPKINELKAKLDRLDPTRAGRSKNRQIIQRLLPVIEEKQRLGFRLDEIYDVLQDDLTIQFATFKTYLKQARKEAKEQEENGNGTKHAVRGSGRR